MLLMDFNKNFCRARPWDKNYDLDFASDLYANFQFL